MATEENIQVIECITVNNNNTVIKDTLSILKSVFVHEEPTEDQINSYVYNVLRQYPEGELQLQYFYFEKNKDNRSKLLEKKGRLYFSTSTVAKVVVLHEVHRTQNWRYYNFCYIK